MAKSVRSGLGVVIAQMHRGAAPSQAQRDKLAGALVRIVVPDCTPPDARSDVGDCLDSWITIQDWRSDFRNKFSYPATICSCVKSRKILSRPARPILCAASALS